MFGFTKKTEYALMALTRLVQQESSAGDPLSARQIAEEYNLPVPLLMNVLKELQRQDIITSIRGARGGYQLGKSPQDLSVLEIVQAIEGPVKTAACCQDPENPTECTACEMTETCPIIHAVHSLHDKVVGFLKDMTLHDFVNTPKEQSLNIVSSTTE